MTNIIIRTNGLQLKDGNTYNFIPEEPTEECLGGISLEDKKKYDEYEQRIAALEALVNKLSS